MNTMRIPSLVFLSCFMMLAAGSVNAQSGEQYQSDKPWGSIGAPITFHEEILCIHSDPHETAYWDFGSGASPANATTPFIFDGVISASCSQDVTYSTPGDKSVKLTIVDAAGNSDSTTLPLHIYDCTAALSIPHDAIVINPNSSIDGNGKTYWVNRGSTLNAGRNDTIFAELGSTITDASNCLVYMKPGSVFKSSSGNNTVVLSNGTNITPSEGDINLSCPFVHFDYTNAPTNPAVPLNVKSDIVPDQISISPNPTTGFVSIKGLPSNDLSISVINLLGETVMELQNLYSSDFRLDLSKLVVGTYYIRFSSSNSVVTKKVVKQ